MVIQEDVFGNKAFLLDPSGNFKIRWSSTTAKPYTFDPPSKKANNGVVFYPTIQLLHWPFDPEIQGPKFNFWSLSQTPSYTLFSSSIYLTVKKNDFCQMFLCSMLFFASGSWKLDSICCGVRPTHFVNRKQGQNQELTILNHCALSQFHSPFTVKDFLQQKV